MTEEIHEEDSLESFYNALHEGKFIEEVEDGFTFDVGADKPAFVGKDELPEDAAFVEGDTPTLLVERPYGKYWAASLRKVGKLEMWDEFEKLAEENAEIEGKIVGSNKGGLSVDVGIRAFVPKSQIDIHRVDDFSPYLGRKEKFRIIEFDKKRCNLVLSRRELLEENREEDRKELLENLEAGQEFDGVVRNVVKYGAFVDIGGLEGLLHKSNMSWGRLDHPSELFRPGDEVRVAVLEYDEKKKRLSLGRKQLLDNPWESIEEKFSEGEVLQGRVVSLADFGAFVEVERGLEGLVHVTELSWTDRIDHPREVLEIGAEVGVKVIGIDTENRRLSLSIKRLEPNPWDALADKYSVGQKITGRVMNLAEFGVFVEIEPGIDGLVHVSDISWTERIDDPAELFQPGDEIEVVLLDIDPESTRISLGIKQLSDDPWDLAESVAVPGKKIDVRITRTTEFGAFAEIVEGIEGLIHISELREEHVERVTDVVTPNKEVKALVTSFDRANQRIGLSLKRDELDDGSSNMREYTDEGDTTATLGDILRDRLGLTESSVTETPKAADQEE